ncbi:hypothetical protein [Microbacterium sp. CFBP9034]|uniref:hypothetical protein n=1 Tax=Microbacterium sp. CFBP9034 TaxID=3096540 RepID=UPI002A6AE0FC|nr:hypothetical protein [Microbacterium sp. CFBP9034]MDY0910892.1 hypothetical protein [Microbacterium sp. CFBP9034]
MPKLPGELSRRETQYSLSGTPYENIDVSIQGDRTRLFVPHASPPSLSTSVSVVWYYHSNGGSYTDLNYPYKYASDPLIDHGLISICPNHGGPFEFAGPKAATAARNAIAYVNSLWRVGRSFGRANSAGGALMGWAFGNKLVPNRYGMYMASAVYDVMDIYRRDPIRVGLPYGYSTTRIQATNPAKLPQSAWTGMRIRASYATEDQVVPPQAHCMALATKAAPVAVEASLLQVTGGEGPGGHYIAANANREMVATFQRWTGW